MFDPTKEVPSLELCKELKELGFPQKGAGYFWIKTEDGEWGLYLIDEQIYDGERVEVCDKKYVAVGYLEEDATYLKVKEIIKAPTLREIGEWLPEGFEEFKLDGKFWVKDKRDYNYLVNDENEANARTKMLIWLVKNGYICFYENKEG